MILEKTPEGILSDDDAAWMASNLSTVPPDKKLLAESKLHEYKVFRAQHPSPAMVERDAKNESAVLGLYEAPDKADFGPLYPTLPEAEKGNVRTRVANEYFLSHTTKNGREMYSDPMAYAAERGRVAGQLFEGRGADSDTAFAAEAKTYLGKRRDFKIQDESFAAAAAAAVLKLEPSDPMTDAAKMLEAAKGIEGVDPEQADQFLATYRNTRQAAEEKFGPYRPVAKQIRQLLEQDSGRKEGDSGDSFTTALDAIMTVPDDVLPGVFQMIDDTAADSTGAAGKVGKNLKRGLMNSLKGVASNDFREGVLTAIGQITGDGGSLKIRDGETVKDAVSRMVFANNRATAVMAGPYAGVGEAFASGRSSTADEDKEAKALLEKNLQRNIVAGKLLQIEQQNVDPATSKKMIARALYSSAYSIGAMAPVFMTWGGMVIAQGSYADTEFQRQISMGTDPRTAHVMGNITGAVQAGLENIGVKLLTKGAGNVATSVLSKLPGVAPEAAGRLAFGSLKYGGAARIAGGVGLQQAGEYTEEVGQNYAKVFTAKLAEDMGLSIPEAASAQAEYSNFRVFDAELWMTLLPITGTFGAYHGFTDNAAGVAARNKLLSDTTAMQAVGASPEEAARVAALPVEQRAKAWESVSTSLNAKSDTAAAAQQAIIDKQQEAKESAVTAMQDAGVTMERGVTPDGAPVYRVSRGDTVTEHASAPAALAAVQEHMGQADREANGPLLQMLAELDANPLSPVQQGSVTIGQGETVADFQTRRAAVMQDTNATPQERLRAERESSAMADRQKVYEAQNPDKPVDWRAVSVGGQSELEVKDGVAKAVIKVASGQSAYTALEEKTEAEASAWVQSQGTTWTNLESMIREVEKATGDTYLNGHTAGVDAGQDQLSVKEAYSELAQVHATGKSRAGKAAPSGITEVARMDRMGARMNLRQAIAAGKVSSELVARLKAHVAWLKAVVSKAIRLNKARREAGGAFAIDEFLNKSIGMEADAVHANEVVKEAARIYTGPTAEDEANGIAFNLKARVSLDDVLPALIEAVEQKADYQIGIRALHPDESPQIGETMPESSVWEDDVRSEESLGGTAAFSADNWKEATKYLGSGTRFAILDGQDIGSRGMPEKGARAYRDAVVVALIDPQEKGLLSISAEEALLSEFQSTLPKEGAGAFGPAQPVASSLSANPQTAPDPNAKAGLKTANFKTFNAESNPQSGDSVNASFRLTPIETLDKLAAQMAKQTRDPDARRKVYEQMLAAFSTLRRNWTETRDRFNNKGKKTGVTDPLSERRSVKELDKEQAFREAAAFQDATAKYGADITPAEEKQARTAAKEVASKWREEQDAIRSEDWDPRAVMLRHLRTLDAILSALPPEVRAKVGGWTAVASLKTQEAMQKELAHRLEVADRELEIALKKDAREAIQKVLDKAKAKVGENRVAKGKLTIETQDILDRVRVYAGMTVAESEAAIAAAQGRIDSAKDEAELMKATDEYLILDATGALFDEGPGGKTAAELTDALDFIEGVYVKGRTGFSVLADNLKQTWDGWRGAVIEKNGAATSDDAENRKVKDRKLGRNVISDLNSVLEAQFNIHQQLIDLMGEKHPVTLHFSKAIRNAREAARYEKHTEEKTLYSWLKSRTSAKTAARQSILLAELSTTIESPVSRVEGRKVTTDEISIDLAEQIVAGQVEDARYPQGSSHLKLLGESLRAYNDALAAWDAKPDGRRPERKYLTSERVTDPGVKKLRTMSMMDAINDTLLWQQARYKESNMERHGLGEDYINQVEAWLSPEAKTVRDFIRDRYGSEYNGMNQTFRALFNMNMPRGENYARAGFVTPGMTAEAMGPDGLPSSPGGSSIGSIKGRIAHTAEPKRQNALVVRMAHVAQISHWKAAAVTARDLRAVFSPVDVRNSIIAKHGEKAYDRLMIAIKTFEAGGWKEAMGNLDGHDLVQRLLSTGVANSLAANIGSIMAQVPAFLTAATRIGPVTYAKNLAKLAVQPTLLADIYHDNSLELRRGGTFSRGQMFAGITGRNRNIVAQGIMRAGEMGTEALGIADAAFTTVNGAVSYLAHLEDFKATQPALPEALNEKDRAKWDKLSKEERDEWRAVRENIAREYALDQMRQTIEESAQPEDFTRKSNFENQISGSKGVMMIAMRTIFMFKGAARAATANVIQTLKQAGSGDISPKVAGGRIAALVFVIPILEQVMRSLYRDMASDDSDDELWRKSSTWKAAMASVFTSGIPVVGSVVDAIKVQVIGGHTMTVQDPATRLITDSMKFAKKALSEDGIDINEVIAAAHATAVGLSAASLPGGELIEGVLNLEKTGEGIAGNLKTTDAEKDQKYREGEAKKKLAKERKAAKEKVKKEAALILNEAA